MTQVFVEQPGCVKYSAESDIVLTKDNFCALIPNCYHKAHIQD